MCSGASSKRGYTKTPWRTSCGRRLVLRAANPVTFADPAELSLQVSAPSIPLPGNHQFTMKKLVLSLFTLVAILSSASFAQTPEEKAALDRFQKDVEAMKAWAKEKEKGF